MRVIARAPERRLGHFWSVALKLALLWQIHSPVGAIAAVSTIKITLLSGARVQCNAPLGTAKSDNVTPLPSKRVRIIGKGRASK
jgi:hypothetical protein